MTTTLPLAKTDVGIEQSAFDELPKRWADFCDCDPFPGSDTFAERMEAAGLIYLRLVEDDDLDDSFAAERGIEAGGNVWDLTDEGRRAMSVALATTKPQGA
jgi:hypothetical protein